MLNTFTDMVTQHVKRASQIWHLARMDFTKSTRGTALGIVWLFLKPAVYVLVFWFALSVGLRGERQVGDYPYILWLMSGLIPWFFMSSMISTGSNVYARFTYLVNRIPFSMPCISTVFALSKFILDVMLMAVVVLVALATGWGLTIYAIQLPFIMLTMLVFWDLFSMMVSPLSAIAKDFNMFIKTIGTPIFWASGVIFRVDNINIPIVKTILAWDPVTVLVTWYRAALCDRFWIWDRPDLLIPFVCTFALTLFFAILSQKKLGKAVSDEL